MTDSDTLLHTPTCDMFCRVIDNFGDAGIAWRLAQSFARENGWQVRLIIDDRKTLSAIVPEIIEQTSPQVLCGISIDAWENALTEAPADIVIELFSCFLPEDYEARIHARIEDDPSRTPVVLALDYLTAESYAEESNGLQSPHPRYGYAKTFLFPGFSEKTCGIIREANLMQHVETFRKENRRADILTKLGADPRHPLTLFFFAYPQSQVKTLAQAFAQDQRALQIIVALGKAGEILTSELTRLKADHVAVVHAPMVPQKDFDDVLLSCDAALVRGEDSTMRAQLMGTPLIWMLYPQEENTHWVKFSAFADLYQQTISPELRPAWLEINRLANGHEVNTSAWSTWRDAYDQMCAAALLWQKQLFASTSLTERLTKIVLKQLK